MERLWKNAGATGRKRSERFKPRNGSTSQISFPPAATACPQNRMVRRGSTVRVRQNALQKSRKTALFVSDLLAQSPACARYGAVYGAFRSRTRLLVAVPHGRRALSTPPDRAARRFS